MRYIAALLSLQLAFPFFPAPAQQRAAPQQEQNLLPFTSNGRDWGYEDESGKVIIAPHFEAALPFSEGLAAVKQNGKYGFIDSRGLMKIQPRFNRAKWFSLGVAPVREGDSWTYVDKNGHALWGKFEDAGVFSGKLAPVKIGQKYGFIDLSGGQVIAPKFDASYAFKDGLAPISVGGKYGFIDQTGKIVVSPSYDRVLEFSEGKAAVRKDGYWGYVDAVGGIAIAPHFDSAGSFRSGIASVITGGQPAEVLYTGGTTKYKQVFSKGTQPTPSANTPLISYRIESEPPGATIYAIPLVRWLQIAKTTWTEASLWEFLRGTTASDLDLFDQKYLILLDLKGDLRTCILDVIQTSQNRKLQVVFR